LPPILRERRNPAKRLGALFAARVASNRRAAGGIEEPRKLEFGAWMLTAMRMLAPLLFLLGTAFDIFGYSAERRTERQLIADYERVVNELLDGLGPARVALAAEIAAIPEFIRGYGHVKDRHLRDAKAREAQLLAQWRDPRAASVRIPIRVAA
jgi:indolepyruvate ferredoxin oxidoreductase